MDDGGSTGVDRTPEDPAGLTWQVDREGPVNRLTPRGRLDGASAPVLRDGLLRCLAEYPAAVVLDLSALWVGDEAMLASIVSAGGGLPPVPLLLAAAAGDLARRLERLDLAPLYPTPETARAAPTTPAALADRFAEALPDDRSAPAQGRTVVERACRAWGLADLVPPASLVVSELSANAVTHGLPPLRLVVARTGTGVHLVVQDGSPRPPLLRSRPDGQPTESGNGLHLVAAFADDWGTRPTVDGKAVWASISIGAG